MEQHCMEYPSFYRGICNSLCFFLYIWQESIALFFFLFVLILWSSSPWPFNLSTISNTHQCIAEWIRMLKISFDAKANDAMLVWLCQYLVRSQNSSFQVILCGVKLCQQNCWCLLFGAGILCSFLGNSNFLVQIVAYWFVAL